MSLEGASTKTNIYLVTFMYGNPKVYFRLTNANANVPSIRGKFFSTPSLDIELPVNHLLEFEQESAKVTFDATDWLFASRLADGRSSPEVSILIEEKLSEAGEDKTLTRFNGIGRLATKNINGKSGHIRITGRSDKARLNFPLGFPANATCGWEFGDADTCGYDIDAAVEVGRLTMSDLSSRVVDISGLIIPGSGDYWKYGKVVYLGHSILIRNWARATATTFNLAELPPVDWHDQDVSVFPGCSKTTTDCAFFGRLEESFSGIGLRSNDYNPLFETN